MCAAEVTRSQRSPGAGTPAAWRTRILVGVARPILEDHPVRQAMLRRNGRPVAAAGVDQLGIRIAAREFDQRDIALASPGTRPPRACVRRGRRPAQTTIPSTSSGGSAGGGKRFSKGRSSHSPTGNRPTSRTPGPPGTAARRRRRARAAARARPRPGARAADCSVAPAPRRFWKPRRTSVRSPTASRAAPIMRRHRWLAGGARASDHGTMRAPSAAGTGAGAPQAFKVTPNNRADTPPGEEPVRPRPSPRA